MQQPASTALVAASHAMPTAPNWSPVERPAPVVTPGCHALAEIIAGEPDATGKAPALLLDLTVSRIEGDNAVCVTRAADKRVRRFSHRHQLAAREGRLLAPAGEVTVPLQALFEVQPPQATDIDHAVAYLQAMSQATDPQHVLILAQMASDLSTGGDAAHEDDESALDGEEASAAATARIVDGLEILLDHIDTCNQSASFYLEQLSRDFYSASEALRCLDAFHPTLRFSRIDNHGGSDSAGCDVTHIIETDAFVAELSVYLGEYTDDEHDASCTVTTCFGDAEARAAFIERGIFAAVDDIAATFVQAIQQLSPSQRGIAIDCISKRARNLEVEMPEAKAELSVA